jgi:uracil-DNA glycosylase family 4
MEEFDFDTSKYRKEPSPVPKIQNIADIYNNRFKSWEERVLGELSHVQSFTISCSMCNLGRNPCEEHDTVFDPHVFSTMKASQWMVVGQNPGYNECLQHEPFVGEAGKFFNNQISRGGLSRKDFYISNCVKCLRYNSRVQLADGSFRLISQLVREKYHGEVKCVIDGVISNRKVIGWYKSNLANRDVYKLGYKYSARSNRNDYRGAYLTGDHKVLTMSTYKDVSKLTSKDLINTGTICPDEITEQIIIGTMLGDSSCTQNRLSSSHSLKQKEYVQKFINILGDYNVKYDEGYTTNKAGKKFKFCRYWTSTFPYFRYLKDIWYRNNRKVIPLNIKLTPIILAVWYMDDGSLFNFRPNAPKAEFACNDFSERDVDLLLRCFYDIGITVKKRYAQGWRLRLNTENSEKLFRIISEFIIPSLRYKLPLKFRNASFNNIFRNRTQRSFFDTPIIKKKKCIDKSMYCLDIEEAHNFVTLGGVVHNCHTVGNAQPTTDHMIRCEPILRLEMMILRPVLVIALGSIAFKALCPKSEFSDNLGKIVKSEKFGVNVFPVYHPSPRNINLPERRDRLIADLAKLCKLIRAYRKSHPKS